MILLEVLIALSLMAILLTFLFSFFVENGRIEKKLDTARMCISERGHLQTRLQAIFSSIDRGSLGSFFYTKTFDKQKGVSLIVQFDNGIDPDPAFSGPLLGRIYLDSKNNLTLAIWPLTQEKEKPWMTEVLLPRVKDFAFEFLGPNSAPEHGQNETIRPINANFAWRSHWPKSSTTIPSIVRLKIVEERSSVPIHYAFILPVPELLITYQEKSAI